MKLSAKSKLSDGRIAQLESPMLFLTTIYLPREIREHRRGESEDV